VTLATVMVHADVDPRSESSRDRVRLAARLAERFDALLIGVTASVLPPYPAEGFYFVTKDFVEKERHDIAETHKQAEAAFRESIGASASKAQWRSGIELPETFVVSEARSADIVVVGRGAQGREVGRALDAGATVLRIGRPVLIVPPGVDDLRLERVVVGWKDTREARRALGDALPLLCKANAVTVVEVCDDGLEGQGRRHVEDVAAYLGKHRITVASALASTVKGGIAADLIRIANAEGGDLVVTGAYGHSRLGEWFFGGVTRDLLASSPICCLMSS
jgi:nucleotide-binding universal stress UspA family protein